MKKIFILVLLICFMVMCTACGGESEGSTDAEGSTVSEVASDSDNAKLIKPSVDYVVDGLLKVPTILETEADTEKDGSWINKEINEQKIATIYFASSLIDQKQYKDETVAETGTKRGGSIDIFETEEAAKARDEYLAGFDGKGVLDSGSHVAVGTIVIRTSLDLSKEYQDILTNSIISMLTDGTLPEETAMLPIATPEPSPEPIELAPYFEAEAIEKIMAVSGISNFSMTTKNFDEGFEIKPKAVIFFEMDSIDANEIDDINEYDRKVKCGGCIEIYEDWDAAEGRNGFLLGYYLFDTTGGKHKNVGNFVIQTSKKLGEDEQERLITEFSGILAPEAVATPTPKPEPTPTPGPTATPQPTPTPTIAPTEVPIETSEPTVAPTEEPTEEPVEVNPYNKVTDYDLSSIRADYAHVDSDVVRLGNGEGVWFTIEASPTTITADDISFLYDETMLEVVDLKFSTVGNRVKFEVYVKAKKAGVSDVFIASSYDLWEDFENATGYNIPVKGLDSSEGRIVYITSSGEKYHFSESCAGAGAYETTISDAQIYEYGVCGKCAK